MADKAKNNILQAKYARIIELVSKELKMPLLEAMSVFYNSKTFELVDEGVSDLHCRSDHYLAQEVVLEVRQSRFLV